jgi:hypothetical protein
VVRARSRVSDCGGWFDVKESVSGWGGVRRELLGARRMGAGLRGGIGTKGLGLGKRSWRGACGKMEVVEGSYSWAAEGKTECKIV